MEVPGSPGIGQVKVSGQSPQPIAAQAGPEQGADDGDGQSDNHQEFAKFTHPVTVTGPAEDSRR